MVLVLGIARVIFLLLLLVTAIIFSGLVQPVDDDPLPAPLLLAHNEFNLNQPRR